MPRNILKQARRDKGLTQQVVAEHLGISDRHYKYIEAGRSVGRVELWDKLEISFRIPQPILRMVKDYPSVQEGSP